MNKGMKFLISGVSLLCILGAIGIYAQTNVEFDTKIPEATGDKIIEASGLVQGYTSGNRAAHTYHVRIDYVVYEIEGINEKQIESMVGEEVSIKLLDNGNYYEYLGIDDPIVVMSYPGKNETEDERILFMNWMEHRRPIIFGLLHVLYSRDLRVGKWSK